MQNFENDSFNDEFNEDTVPQNEDTSTIPNPLEQVEQAIENELPTKTVQISREDLISKIKEGYTLTKKEKRYNEEFGTLTDVYNVPTAKLRATIKSDDVLKKLYYAKEEVKIELI